MFDLKYCPICKLKLKKTPLQSENNEDEGIYDCDDCGKFIITGQAVTHLNLCPVKAEIRKRVRKWIRENQHNDVPKIIPDICAKFEYKKPFTYTI